MSASRCFRCAMEAARPSKRINISTRPFIQSRSYAQVTNASEPKTAGTEIKETDRQRTRSNPASIEQIQSQPKRSAPASTVTQQQALTTDALPDTRLDRPLPPNVAAAFRTPYRHTPTHGIPVASLQLRSFSVRNLEFFADFALRVAYYLKLPASGPVPLPKRIERWTTLRSNFVHKKSQENFERITMKRLITIYDGAPEVVEIWLACLRKWQFYGVGMKANVWEFESLDVASKMDKQKAEIEKELDAKLANFGWNNDVAGKRSIQEMLRRQGMNVAGAPGQEVREEIKGAKNIDLFRDVDDSMSTR